MDVRSFKQYIRKFSAVRVGIFLGVVMLAPCGVCHVTCVNTSVIVNTMNHTKSELVT